jgi:hypothetical protein
MTQQAVIYFKNGKKDWIDPVDADGSIKYDNNTIFINNTYFTYDFPRELVDHIEVIEIE